MGPGGGGGMSSRSTIWRRRGGGITAGKANISSSLSSVQFKSEFGSRGGKV
jgi:hypothetical protein